MDFVKIATFAAFFGFLMNVSAQAPQKPADSLLQNGAVRDRISPVGLGFMAGGGGIFGLGMRGQVSKGTFLEAGFSYRPIFISIENFQTGSKHLEIQHSWMVSGGLVFLPPLKWDARKNRYRSFGCALHAGHSLINPTNFAAAGLVWETQKRRFKQKSLIVELGIGGYQERFRDRQPFYENDPNGPVKPMVYWKFLWNSFLTKQPNRPKQ